MKHTIKNLKTIMAIGLVFSITALSVIATQHIQQNSQTSVQLPLVEPQTTPLTPTQPPVSPASPKIELVFALDTTASMGGLIQATKEKIWSIASTMAGAKNAPEISIGLVAFRDRGDEYVTKIIPLSADLDSVYAALMDLKAEGGGDGPESVNQALLTAVNDINWSQDPNSYKVIFLVGDAPGHNDYANDVPYPRSILQAKQKGIVINTIQAGDNQQTSQAWHEIAALGAGEHFQVAQQGSAVAIATPFDESIAKTSAKLDSTRLYFGSKQDKLRQERKQAAVKKLHENASASAMARRAKFNSSASGLSNFAGDDELIQALADKSIDLSKLETEMLPKPMQAMELSQREDYIKTKATQREKHHSELSELTKKRDAYIKKELAKNSETKNSFDEQIFTTLKAQASSKGLDYSEAKNDY